MIVGLCGYKGSGKSIVAKYIEENYKFKRINFKDELIKEMKERFPRTIEAIMEHYPTSSFFEDKPPIARALMQEYGTEVRRADHIDYWATKWLKTVSRETSNVVTDDVRFNNELESLRGLGGVLIRVVRDDIHTGGEHASEKEQEGFVPDFTIVAKKGELSSVYQQIDKIMNHIKAD